MVFRVLIRYLLNNDLLITKLSESYPMRRAAQLTAYLFTKGKAITEETVGRIENSEALKKQEDALKEAASRIGSFSSKFSQELKEGFKKIKDKP